MTKEQLELRVFNALGAGNNTSDNARMELAKRVIEQVVETHSLVPVTERVWVTSNERAGYFLVKRGDTTLAHTKSLNVARHIRDALNAPDTIVGQTIEVDESTYRTVTIGDVIRQELVGEGRITRGVAMALTPFAGFTGIVLRLPDNRLEVFALTKARIVEPEAPEPTVWEP